MNYSEIKISMILVGFIAAMMIVDVQATEPDINQCLADRQYLIDEIQGLQNQILSTCEKGAFFIVNSPTGVTHKYYCSEVTEL
tara:strand:+ start:63 stop:311 length:249 start_codon:yes stop_codon:yes gene_type:complete